MKKSVILFICLLIISVSNVSACENKDELINDNYDYLTSIYPDYVLDEMTCNDIQFVINEDMKLVSTDEVFYPDVMPRATHSTSSKSITLTYYQGNANSLVTLSLDWTRIPTVRSYDVIALRFSGVSNILSRSNCYFQYETSTLSNRITSNSSSDNITTASNGVGFAYKLPTDSDLSSLEFFMQTYVTGSGSIYGTYQHAISSVTKTNAMNYGFSISGLGGVIDYSSSTTHNAYDGMAGVTVST